MAKEKTDERTNQDFTIALQIFLSIIAAVGLTAFGIKKLSIVMFICAALLMGYIVIAKHIVKTNRDH